MNNIGENIYDNFELLPFDSQGWNSDHNIFREIILNMKTPPKVIIEVGTWKGGSALSMGIVLKELGLDAKIYCVDTWLGAQEFWTTHKETPERNLMLKNGYPQIYYQFLSNVVHRNMQDIIIPVPSTSATAAKIFKHMGIKADLVYIDGSHEYEDVVNDIKYYSELLNPGGVMFGDDFGAWADVSRAVEDTIKTFRVVDDNFWIKE
jgi:cephalosporin hydroxylase